MGKVFILLCLLGVVGCGGKSKAELIQELEYEERELEQLRVVVSENPGDIAFLKEKVKEFDALPENQKTAKDRADYDGYKNTIAEGEKTLAYAREKLPVREKSRAELRKQIDAMK